MRCDRLVDEQGLTIQPLTLLSGYFAIARIPIIIVIMEPIGRKSIDNVVAEVLHYDNVGTIVVAKVILIWTSILHLCVKRNPPVALQIEIAPRMIFSN